MPSFSETSYLHLIIRSTLSEGLGKGIVVYLELSDLVILVGCDPYESTLQQVLGEDGLLGSLGDEL